MPKLPTIVSDRNIYTGSTGAQARASDFYGGGLEDIARGIGNVGDVALRAAQVKDNTWATDAESNFRLEAYDKLSELQYDEDSPEKFRTWANTRLSELQSSAPSKQAGESLRKRGLNTLESGYGSLTNASAQVKIQKADLALDSTLTADIENATKAKQNPGILSPAALLEHGASRAGGRVDSVFGNVAPNKAAAKKAELSAKYVSAALVLGEYESARRIAKEHVKDPEAQRVLMDRIDSDEKKAAAGIIAQADSYMKEQISRSAMGYAVQPMPEEYQSALKRWYPQQFAEHQQKIAAIDGARRQFASWTDEGLTAADRARRVFEMGNSGSITTDAAKVLNEMVKVQSDMEAKDVVGAAVMFDSNARRVFAQYSGFAASADKNPNDPELAGLARSSAARWTETLDGKQRNVPATLRHYMSKDEAATAKDFLEKARDPREVLQAWNNLTRHLPDEVKLNIFDQVAPTNMGRADIDLADKPISAELFGASRAYPELAKTHPKTAEDIKKRVELDPKLKALSYILGDNFQNASVVSSYYQKANALAMGYVVRDNMSVGDAAELATKRIIEDNYNTAVVNGAPVLLDKDGGQDPTAFAQSAKFAMGLIPWDEVAEFQVDGARIDASKLSNEEIDAHYEKLKQSIPMNIATAIDPITWWSRRALLAFERERAKRDPNYYLRASGFAGGFLQRQGDRYYLHMRLKDGRSSAIFAKDGKQFYLDASDLSSPVTQMQLSSGIDAEFRGSTLEEAVRTDMAKPSEKIPSPWKH